MNLVTGATGLLGSHIAEQLRNAKKPVRALVRPNSDTDFLSHIGCELAEGDITDPASIRSACDGVTQFYHAAAKVGDWGIWPDFQRITINGTQNCLDAAIGAKVQRFIHISSISVYGYVHESGEIFDEQTPLGQNLNRWSFYSRAKVAAEDLVWNAYRDNQLPVTIIRPSWLYGQRDRTSIGRLVSLIRGGRAKIIGTGDNRLNLSYAGNVAAGTILAADKNEAVGQAYNMSNDGMITQREYINMIAENLGAEPVNRTVPFNVAAAVGFLLECWGKLTHSPNPPMVSRYAVWLIGRTCFFDTSKARNQLGYVPQVEYRNGIAETVRWYLGQETTSQVHNN